VHFAWQLLSGLRSFTRITHWDDCEPLALASGVMCSFWSSSEPAAGAVGSVCSYSIGSKWIAFRLAEGMSPSMHLADTVYRPALGKFTQPIGNV
jgi:hypothetical protein